MAKTPAPKAKPAAKAKETEAEPAADAEVAAKKAAKKRLFLMIAAVVGGLVLGGGGVGAYFIFGHKSDAETKAAPKVKAVEEKPAAQAVAYVSLPHLSAPILDNGKVLGYVLLDFSLEVNEGEEQANIFQNLPAIRAAFLIDVTQHPIGTPEDPTVIDYAGLGTRLLDVANQAVKGGGIKRVLVTQTVR